MSYIRTFTRHSIGISPSDKCDHKNLVPSPNLQIAAKYVAIEDAWAIVPKSPDAQIYNFCPLGLTKLGP